MISSVLRIHYSFICKKENSVKMGKTNCADKHSLSDYRLQVFKNGDDLADVLTDRDSKTRTSLWALNDDIYI